MKRSLLMLALVLSTALLLWAAWRPDLPSTGDASEAPLFPDLEIERIARIEYRHLLGGVQLRRVEGGWQVAPLITTPAQQLARQEGRALAPAEWSGADGERVELALAALLDLPEGVVVGTNPEKFRLVQVTEAVGQRVQCFDESGRALVDLLIGKHGPDLGSTYVRRTAEERVRLVHRVLNGVFSIEVADWLPPTSALPSSPEEPEEPPHAAEARESRR